VDSFIPYNTVILRVVVSGWDSIAFGNFPVSEGCVCVCVSVSVCVVEAKVLVLDDYCALWLHRKLHLRVCKLQLVQHITHMVSKNGMNSRD